MRNGSAWLATEAGVGLRDHDAIGVVFRGMRAKKLWEVPSLAEVREVE